MASSISHRVKHRSKQQADTGFQAGAEQWAQRGRAGRKELQVQNAGQGAGTGSTGRELLRLRWTRNCTGYVTLDKLSFLKLNSLGRSIYGSIKETDIFDLDPSQVSPIFLNPVREALGTPMQPVTRNCPDWAGCFTSPEGEETFAQFVRRQPVPTQLKCAAPGVRLCPRGSAPDRRSSHVSGSS